jgi:hypothetical protein
LLKEVGVEFSKRFGVEHRVIVLDVSREDFIGRLASATDDLDIGLVVSNAGTGNPGEFLKLDRQLLQATLRLSTMAHLNISHHFGAKLAKRGRGGLILAGAMGAENASAVSDAPHDKWQVGSGSPAGRVRYSRLKGAGRGEAFMQIQWCWGYESSGHCFGWWTC